MTMLKVTIDGIKLEVPEGTTIIDAAKTANIKIPTLCKHPDLPPTAACGICVVKVQSMNKMLRACCTPVLDGMEIISNDAEIIEVRRNVLQLILSNHPNDCLKCYRSGSCELQEIASNFMITEQYFESVVKPVPKDDSSGIIVLHPEKCIKCGRCLQVCQDVQNVWALSFLERGIYTRFAPAGDIGDISLYDSPCVRCGQCGEHCPVGAIFIKDSSEQVWNALRDPDKICVAQIAPAVRAAIGESFGFDSGVILTGKLYAVLKRMGFKAIFDTNFGADLTVMEEASEFIERFAHNKRDLPLITTCCPSWVNYMEKSYPDMIEHFSSCKSPNQIVGVLSKTYYPRK